MSASTDQNTHTRDNDDDDDVTGDGDGGDDVTELHQVGPADGVSQH